MPITSEMGRLHSLASSRNFEGGGESAARSSIMRKTDGLRVGSERGKIGWGMERKKGLVRQLEGIRRRERRSTKKSSRSSRRSCGLEAALRPCIHFASDATAEDTVSRLTGVVDIEGGGGLGLGFKVGWDGDARWRLERGL